MKVGEAGHGLTVILAGTVEISQREETGRVPIVTHHAGGFMGELAQGGTHRPAADAESKGDD